MFQPVNYNPSTHFLRECTRQDGLLKMGEGVESLGGEFYAVTSPRIVSELTLQKLNLRREFIAIK